MFGLSSSDIESITKTLRSHPEVEEAIIFGSRAMGNDKPGSDVDFALKGTVDESTATEIAIELNERLPLPYKFDVFAYPTLTNKALIEHIDYYGKTFYRRQP